MTDRNADTEACLATARANRAARIDRLLEETARILTTDIDLRCTNPHQTGDPMLTTDTNRNTAADLDQYTPQDVAEIIVNGMNADDRTGFTQSSWWSGVSEMLQGDWHGIDLDAVLDAIEDEIADLQTTTDHH